MAHGQYKIRKQASEDRQSDGGRMLKYFKKKEAERRDKRLDRDRSTLPFIFG